MLKNRRGFAFCALPLMLLVILFTSINESEAAKKKKRYEDWRELAADMALEFNSAIEDVKNDKYQDAYKHVNDAYFGYYEVQGFERTVISVQLS